MMVERIRCLEYISCLLFLSPASRVPSRLVITAVVIGPETVALVQLRRLAILRPMPLKPGDSPRYIRHLHRRRYIPGFSAKTTAILGTRRADVRLAERSPSRFTAFPRSDQRQVYRWWEAHTTFSSDREMEFVWAKKKSAHSKNNIYSPLFIFNNFSISQRDFTTQRFHCITGIVGGAQNYICVWWMDTGNYGERYHQMRRLCMKANAILAKISKWLCPTAIIQIVVIL